LGRKPTTQELSNYIGCTKEKLLDAINSVNINKSLEEVIFYGDTEITLKETLEDSFNLEDEVVKRLKSQHLYDCIGLLSDIEKKVTKLRLREFTQVKVAETLHINQVNVSRAEKRAIKKLKVLVPEHTKNKFNKSVQMFKKGFSNKDISKKLNLSIEILEIYRTNYNKRIGISSKIKSDKKKEAFNLLQLGYKAKDLSSKLNIPMGTAYGYTHQFKQFNI
jgi:RNA polymerase sporulation-specific sigma factor